MSEPLERMLNETVVLDTATSILYIGELVEIAEYALVLKDADMHDCRDGHANREAYLVEAAGEGVTPNRRSIIVTRSAVISVSRLGDVVVE